uniref:Uncharacterized protein n=1 Tax=Avena sativa TaxID=4498 RepID=A0ACD5XF45_AVESA
MNHHQQLPYHLSNTVVGYLNLLTLLASIPVIGAGLWLAHAASTTPAATCQSALQGPLLAVGFVAFLVSLPGFIGARYHVSWALWLYLAALILLVLALLGAAVFGLVVTAGGGGAQVPGRPYREYRPRDYSSWLRKHVADDKYWRPALACVASSRACREVAGWTPEDYMRRDLTPVQSGCCKPPTSCVYGDGELAVTAVQEEDCYVWRNDPAVLCYGCESCRAGVMEQLRRHCHNLTVLNAALLLVLIAVCSGGCCAYRNARRAEYAYGGGRMSKIHPRWDYFCFRSRWWRGHREQIY